MAKENLNLEQFDTGHPHDGNVPPDGRDSNDFDMVEFFVNGSSVLPAGESKKPTVTLPPDD